MEARVCRGDGIEVDWKQPDAEGSCLAGTSATDVSRLHQALLQSIFTNDVSRLPLTGLPMSTSKLQASASEDGYLLGDNDLEKIVALLLWMAQDFQSNIHIDDIHYAALEVVIKHVDAATGGKLGSLQTASVAKLPELIDIDAA